MAKAPVPGRVKTRLCPPCTWDQAAAIAEAALTDTLAAVVACRAARKVVALDGEPGPWLPPGVEVIRQRGQEFSQRLANAWTDMAGFTGGWGIQIGMDTPQVTASLLDDQLATLVGGSRRLGGAPRAVLGKAADGGWWVIGLAGTDPAAVFRGVPMSTSVTGTAQARRMRRLGLDVKAAPELVDIDDIDDLARVAAGIPNSHTAAAAWATVPHLFTNPRPSQLSA
jgi:glycosyltransferase A (GT-A) superfamily protein (DUF2064 family)